MRTLASWLLLLGLALTLSAPAAAVIRIGLVQVGGTFDPLVGGNPGDTLVLSITYSMDPGDTATLIDPALVWNGSVQSFNAAGSTETGFAAWSGGTVALNPIAVGDITEAGHPGLADGWEKATTISGGATTPCVFGACTSLGTAAFVLTGSAVVIGIGAVGMPFGTVVGDGNFNDITSDPTKVQLGYFVPEPTTAGLLGLGLLALAAARRHRTR